jgi:hypothetical protein
MKRYTLLLLAGLLLAACGQPTANDAGAANAGHDHSAGASPASPAAAGALQPVLATSEIVTGPNRIALGLLQNNVPIKDADQTKVQVRYYKLSGDQGTLVGTEEARYYGEGLGERGAFIVHPTFDSAGPWGLEVEAQRPGQPAETHRLDINVAAEGDAPMVGQPAPRSKTPTASQVADLTTISSDTEPDPRLYQLSVEQAVTSRKPSLIMFATPGYCQTAVCGPGVDVLAKLVDTFGDKINAVHVEVYRLPYDAGKTVPAMSEWGLRTEPWLFLVDKNGLIAGRYEGGITMAELEPAVAQLVADQ